MKVALYIPTPIRVLRVFTAPPAETIAGLLTLLLPPISHHGEGKPPSIQGEAGKLVIVPSFVFRICSRTVVPVISLKVHKLVGVATAYGPKNAVAKNASPPPRVKSLLYTA